jgi:hypothetical protein
MPILLIVALLGTVLAAQAMGAWSVSGRDAVDVSKMTAADLKGWMTLQQVMDGLKISQDELYAVGNIPADTPASTALKELERFVEVSTLREKLTARSGASSATTNAVPAQAVETTAPAPTPSPEKTALHATPTPLPPGQVLPADQIKGKMTLREVSQQCAVPLDKLLAALKLNAADADAAIKDLVAQGKIAEVTAVQNAVGEMQK